MFKYYYLISFILSFLCWIYYISSNHRKININLAMICSIVTISNGGYLALALTDNEKAALLAQKIIYIAVIYAPLFIFFNITAICKVNINKIINTSLIVICSSIYGLVLTIGYFPIYYKSIKLHFYKGITYITKEYGPAHSLYTIMLYLLILASLIVVIYSLTNQQKVSYKNSLKLLVILIIFIISYFGKKIVGIKLQLMPILYIVLLILLFILYYQADMYDISNAILDTLEQDKYGYIVLNKDLKYIASNDMAKVYYPYLNNIKIDSSVENDNSLFFQIKKKVNKLDEVSSVTWNKSLNKYNLKCELRTIYNDGKKRGYLLELIDDTKQQLYIKSINTYNNELKEAIDKKNHDIIEIQDKIILGIANVVESRDNSTGGHIKRTSEVVKIFVEKLKYSKLSYKLTEEFFSDVVKAAPMHDLGKIAIDDKILRKPGRFTPAEYAEMKKHAKEGMIIIDSVLDGVEDESFVHIAKNIAHYHHEKYDGSGYPDNLKGEEIPIEARIMALADVFDALVSKRCYKDKFSYDEAFNIIENSIGNHFDPELGKIFIECRSNLEYYYNSVEESIK